MKKILFSAALLLSSLLAGAQLLKITTVNGERMAFKADQLGSMTFENGETLTIARQTFKISEIEKIEITEDGDVSGEDPGTDPTPGGNGIATVDEALEDNIVAIALDGASAKVTFASNLTPYISAEGEGAHLTVTQSTEVSDANVGEITYRLSGATNDGSVTLIGEFKTSVELLGVDITSSKGAALKVDNGKRIAIRVVEGTVNNLKDCAGGDQKAALHVKGHTEFKQKGTLNVTGLSNHAIYSKEYIQIKNTKINILGSVKDAINCNQYFLMESGTITATNVGDDGLQCSFKDDIDREAEDTGTITIQGGTIDMAITADGAKAVKAGGDFLMEGGSITATMTGQGMWDDVDKKVKACAGISTNGKLTVNKGTINFTATGAGGKGLSSDGVLEINGGDFTISTSGNMCVYQNNKINNNFTNSETNLASNYKSSPKAIKGDSEVYINGGKFNIKTTGANGEGIESKNTLTIGGGEIFINAYDDGINSSLNTMINGGDICIMSKKGDAIDSNSGLTITGGTIRVFGAGGSEQGYDTDRAVVLSGGTMLAVGGGNSAPTSAGTLAYVTGTLSLKAGQTVTAKDSAGTVIATFVIPAEYSGSGSTILVGSEDMVSGASYTVTNGTSSVTLTAKTSGGSTGPGMGGGGGGGWGWH